MIDRQLQVYARFDARMRNRIRDLITDDLIAEHARAPLGRHSDALARVLNYFRRAPVLNKYVIIAVRPWQEYRLATLSGERGRPATLLEDACYASEEAAHHGLFLRRVRDLMAEASS